ncbi:MULTISPECIES: FadR/GntR family transcriptional regulator [Pseudomonas]|uniref:FadR family transcriptional regulator n=2 Tax=Pseudomonas TaxID=286 RepID=A0A1L7NAR8_PSEPU|nr:MULTISPECIES: FadR/GntR family transcriptional regulator [Pseudomonas]ERT16761.1 GntR family transcriptional regulator [Pseudomonas putida SJ3]MBP2084199.1 GntR family transcriptional repressor for pyruvate dehydrogenase complex [Pseudomonas sp. PvP089]MBP2090099.1 GntR family transcriptional repressor for pyruvate dehydrogenase complex [Pseudomonas sp. PvP088]MCE0782549.1 FadR family transcriptional regulator [Pseudomonas sp. NMI542_15]MCE0967894.1 FadR family transcriptional regulator [Ps
MISSSTVVNSVVEKLRQALARGQWRTGDMLPGQRELAEQLGISRPSLREAVTVLETLGLVRSLPGKGVLVLDADAVTQEQGMDTGAAASLADVLELRYTLEPFIVGLVAQSANSQDVGQLRLTLMDMREALEADDSEAGVKAYIAFHEALFTLTTNPIFQSVVQQTGNALKQSADMLRNSPEHLAARLKENEAVVRAIRERNSAQASAQMRQHILAEGQRMGIPLNIPDEHPRP